MAFTSWASQVSTIGDVRTPLVKPTRLVPKPIRAAFTAAALGGLMLTGLAVPVSAAAAVAPGHGATASTARVRAASVAAGRRDRAYVLDQRIPVGAGVDLGGFSDLYPADRSGKTFWAVTDRGPNYDADGGQGFVVPTFTPRIVKIRLVGRRIRVERQLPLKLRRGYADPVTGSSYVTGLSNLPTDDASLDTAGRLLPRDPYGVDTEGLVRAVDGTFWMSEEYRPSVLHVAADGTILSRLVPRNDAGLDTPGVSVQRVLPAVLAEQKRNRGLEGLAISPDGRTLYAGMQSPLPIPDKKQSKLSRNLRVVRIDVSRPTAPRVTAEFLNVREPDSAADDDWKTSAMVWLGRDRLLIEERDGELPTRHTDLYAVDFRRATNLLGSAFDDSGTRPALEELSTADLAARRVVAGAKLLVFDVAAAGVDNGKIEGIALTRRGRQTQLAMINDNDFDISGIDADRQPVTSGTPSRVDVVPLPIAP